MNILPFSGHLSGWVHPAPLDHGDLVGRVLAVPAVLEGPDLEVPEDRADLEVQVDLEDPMEVKETLFKT